MLVNQAVQVVGAAPCLAVADVLAATDFYCNSLGFQSDSADEWFALVSRDGISLMLWQGEVSPNGAWDAFFWVTDIDALHQELLERGVSIERAPETMCYDLREMTVIDNNGYVLTFGQNLN